MEIRGNTNIGKTNQGNQTFHSKKLSLSIYNRPFKDEEEGVETTGRFVAVIRV